MEELIRRLVGRSPFCSPMEGCLLTENSRQGHFGQSTPTAISRPTHMTHAAREQSGAGAHEKSHKRKRARSRSNGRAGEENKRYSCSPARQLGQLTLLQLPHSQPSSRARTHAQARVRARSQIVPGLPARVVGRKGSSDGDVRAAAAGRPAAAGVPALRRLGRRQQEYCSCYLSPLSFLVAVACCIPCVCSCARSPLIKSV